VFDRHRLLNRNRRTVNMRARSAVKAEYTDEDTGTGGRAVAEEPAIKRQYACRSGALLLIAGSTSGHALIAVRSASAREDDYGEASLTAWELAEFLSHVTKVADAGPKLKPAPRLRAVWS
jgi:hypothetical protein